MHKSQSLQFRVRLRRAGPILGSAYVEFDLQNPATGEKKCIVFSVDLGAPHASILPATKSPYKADVLAIESTYGKRRLHEARRCRRMRLEKVPEHALSNQGTVLIPAFSSGRTLRTRSPHLPSLIKRLGEAGFGSINEHQ